VPNAWRSRTAASEPSAARLSAMASVARVALAICGLLCACSSEEDGAGLVLKSPDGGDAGTSVTAGDASAIPDATSASTDAASDVVVDAKPAVVYLGEATWYDAHSANACGMSLAGSDYMVAAMNGDQYKKSLCGTCARIKGPDGEVTVKIVDLCPGCSMGDIDLSEEAFAKIADLDDGRVKITWSFVACP